LELNVGEKCLSFSNPIADRLTTLEAACVDGLPGNPTASLRLSNGKWHLAFFLLRTSVRDGS
jgi:hypothetical protein